ncbi:MAG: hypothetical protein ACK47O_13355, partial [Betaproteobacteria bacterium]
AAAFVSGRWRWQAGRDRWEIQPSLNLTRAQGRGASDLEQTLGLLPAPYARMPIRNRAATPSRVGWGAVGCGCWTAVRAC